MALPRIHSQWLSHETPIAGVINKPQLQANRSLGYSELRLHVSDLMKVETQRAFCEREHVIKKLLNPSVPAQPLNAAFDLLFDLGNALHDNARNRWMRYDEYGDRRVLARWSCLCGDVKHVGVNPRNANICKRCGSHPTVFDEYEVFDDELKIVAHPDFNVVRGKDVIRSGVFDKTKHLVRIVEIKSIDRADVSWNALDAPLGEHVLQGSFYYHLMKKNGYRVDPIISFLYGERSLKESLFRGNPWKEFEVKASPYARVDKFFTKARNVKKSIDDRIIPERKLCDKMKCGRASNCAVAHICFSIPGESHEVKAAKISKKRKIKLKARKPLCVG